MWLHSCATGNKSSAKGLPKGLKGRDGPRPVHGEEEQPRRRLADVVDVKILWRRQRHNELEKKRKNVRVFNTGQEHQ